MPSSITLTVGHLPTSTSFFLSALQPLGYVFRGRQEQTIGFGPEYPSNTPADFWITQEVPGVPAGAAHVAFPASTRATVQDFFLAALKAGGRIHGEPCQRDATGYYSAAVIDFDGNSIEAVYRPAFTDEANKENVDVRSLKASSTVTPRSVASQARSKGPTTVVVPQTVVSQAKSRAPSHVSSSSQTQEKPKASGDVLDVLINEARSAAKVARDLVSSFKNNPSTSPPKAAPATNDNTGTGTGTGEAVIGTLLGVAAGAALHYALTNRSKDSNSNDDREDHRFEPRRPSVVGRSMTGPAAVMRPEYSSSSSEYRGKYSGGNHRRAIEAAPSAYTYRSQSQSRDGQRLITMRDNDTRAITYHSSPPSDYTSTVRPTSASLRRMSIDSGFGPGPRDLEASSHASSKASRQSRKNGNAAALPPTSYRAPTVLTEKLSRVSSDSRARGREEKSHSRANSSSRAGRSQASHADQPRSRSHSRSQTTQSRHSRRDDHEEAKTVFHVTESLRRSTPTNPETTPRATSKTSTRSTARNPEFYPLPPSRAATWTGGGGSQAGKSFVSARSSFPPSRPKAPRTVIGRGQAGAEKSDTASVFSKRQELGELDVSEREVRPEDSVSQISVNTVGGGGSGASKRGRTSRR